MPHDVDELVNDDVHLAWQVKRAPRRLHPRHIAVMVATPHIDHLIKLAHDELVPHVRDVRRKVGRPFARVGNHIRRADDDRVLILAQFLRCEPDRTVLLDDQAFLLQHLINLVEEALLGQSPALVDFDSMVAMLRLYPDTRKSQLFPYYAARHLPEEFVVLRMSKTDVFALSQRDLNGVTLSPEEVFLLSRVQEPLELSQLSALSGMAESDGLRAVYTLALGGLLDRNEWPLALGADVLRRTASSEKTGKTKTQTAGTPAGSAHSRPRVADEKRDLEVFFARLNQARDYFDILDVGHGATQEMIKEAYHSLARRFHPDRFHQSDQALRVRIDSAFARIAQAYETLSDASARAAYEARLRGKTARPSETSAAAGKASTEEVSAVSSSNRERAASAFNRGIAALKQNEYNSAVAHFAQAAHLAPQEARYRAQYGQALAGQKQTRRLGESELKVAVSLEPNNVSYRIMLAELYQNLGLRRRAQAELERALISDPKHKHARALLADLQRQS